MAKTSDNKLFSIINSAGEAVLMNLLFLISCIPVVTIGQAWTGLIYAVRYKALGESWFQGYKKGFTKHIGRGIAFFVICAFFVAYFCFTLYSILFYREDGFLMPAMISGALLLFSMLFQISLLLTNSWLELPLGSWLKLAARFSVQNFLRVLAALVLIYFPLALGFFFPDWLFHFALVFIAAYFSVSALLFVVLFNPVFKRFSEDHI